MDEALPDELAARLAKRGRVRIGGYGGRGASRVVRAIVHVEHILHAAHEPVGALGYVSLLVHPWLEHAPAVCLLETVPCVQQQGYQTDFITKA